MHLPHVAGPAGYPCYPSSASKRTARIQENSPFAIRDDGLKIMATCAVAKCNTISKIIAVKKISMQVSAHVKIK
jgi:hypothetical protein